MGDAQDGSHGCHGAAVRGKVRQASVLANGLAVLVLAGVAPAGAQQTETAAAALVFDGVTVVDVEHGKLIPDQRVVIVGNRIGAVGRARAVQVPQKAQVVNARGKYLIPGLWDLHVHPGDSAPLFYPVFLANGTTGIRDAGSSEPLDTLRRWRQEILAGTRVGPPRQLLAGPSILSLRDGSCDRAQLRQRNAIQTCVADPADARYVVDSLKAAGADMIKPHEVWGEGVYFAIAAEARRLGIPFGGHLVGPAASRAGAAAAASDSGASIIDHMGYGSAGEVDTLCGGKTATVERCGPLAEHFRRNGTWVVTTRNNYTRGPTGERITNRLKDVGAKFWTDSLRPGNWLRDDAGAGAGVAPTDSMAYLAVAHRVGLPILAGTDATASEIRTKSPGFSLHAELAVLVAEGLSSLDALQAATLNPAKLLRGTDSLGTVAAGKLADLVLLDADPLADITNTTTIRAVVANGRYFDRAALDHLLAEARAKVRTVP